MELKLVDLVKRMEKDNPDTAYFEKGSFLMKPVYKKNSHVLHMEISLPKPLPYKVWDVFCVRLKKITQCQVALKIQTENAQTSILELSDYISHFVSFHPALRIFQDSLPSLENQHLIYHIAQEDERDVAIQNKHLLKEFLDSCGFELKIDIEEMKVSQKVLEVKMKKEEPKPVKVYEEKKAYNFKPKGKKGLENYVPFSICDIKEECHDIRIHGKIFEIENRTLRTGKDIQTLWIADDDDAIIMKRFERGAVTKEVLNEISKGDCVVADGKVEFDSYSRELVFMPDVLQKVAEVKRVDEAEEKRVELHVHTKLSEMDGVCDIAEFIKTADEWGMDAIALTDHRVVQAFPTAQSVVDGINKKREKPMKILYGVEMNMVDPVLQIVRNADDTKLEEGTYCVFDLETTGLSSRYDHIIEFGGQIVKDRTCIKSLQMFIKPPVELSAFTTELTNISEEHVRNAKPFVECVDEILEFIGDSILVAHNASFDCSFIEKNCKDLDLHFNATILDTVQICRFLYPELKSVKLNLVAKHLGIKLTSHHRAVDDAKATGDIFVECIKKIKEEYEVSDLSELNKIFLEKVDIKKLPTYHIIILAKTQEGIRNLYKLVSEAHIDNFFRRPRTKKSRLAEMRGGLIIGGACEAGEIYRAVLGGKNDEEVKEIMSFYDYVEIQPVENNAYLIEKGNVKDEDELKDINRKIYNLAKEVNKPTVATGDVHFLEPQDEAFRRIIMAGQGFGDAENQPPLYFKTTEEMLKEFSYLGEDIAKEVVIKNPQEIAASVDILKPIPDETYPPKIEGADDDIRNMTMNKVHSIYGENLPEVVQKRLDKELNSIINNGYAVLYLIAQKLVAKSYADGYLVGSRGSVGSSFVATMSDITEVNGLPPHYVCPKCKKSQFFLDGSVSSGADLPDKDCPNCGVPYIKDGHDIPFETFLGFEGDKEPDIDLNFSGDNQADIHKYTEVLFGKGYVFKAGTIGTVAEKTAYGFVKKYLDQKGEIASQAEIERLTIGCTGIKRTTGQHPGGIMVVPNYTDVYNFTPIQRPADDNTSDVTTTHFDYHSISGRLLKLDILGHDDPTVLRMLQDITGIDPKTIPLNDEKVLSLFTRPDALGVTKEELECEVGSYGLPEFGTKFVRQMLVDTQPKTFSDLVRISGLSHGTDVWLNNAQYFIKEGYTTLRDCIATRDDIMVYLMYKGVPPKTAFTIMESVRKGKGLTEEFEKIMRENKVEDWYIESCKRIKYMFPKGHAVAYCMMAVRVAYYKVYYPLAYYATYFTVRGADDFDAELICKGESAVHAKLQELYALGNSATVKDKGLITVLELSFEMYKRGFEMLKVDLYESDATKFQIVGNALRPPLSSLQGVGVNAAKAIFEARKDGEFISKEDLRIRSKVSKTVIETLSVHGCLKGMSETNQLSLF